MSESELQIFGIVSTLSLSVRSNILAKVVENVPAVYESTFGTGSMFLENERDSMPQIHAFTPLIHPGSSNFDVFDLMSSLFEEVLQHSLRRL